MNVKRILALLIIIAIMPTAAFCEDTLTDKAVTLLEYMVAGDYDDALSLMDEEAKAVITAEALQAGCEAIFAQFGKLGDYEPTVAENGYAVIVCEFEKGRVKFTCTFDGDGLVKTLSFMPETYGTAQALPLELAQGARQDLIKLFAGTQRELEGYITLPEGYTSDTPVVVMVQGSGPSDRDETIGSNKPFRDIAYALAESGIAAIRYDKVTYAHPELFTDAEGTTVYFELVEPALEALRLAREMGFKNVYLLGHSLGGMMTPYIMSVSEGGFKGGLILAGTPRKFWEIMRDQSIAILHESEGVSEDDIASSMAAIEAGVEQARNVCAMSKEEALRQTEPVMGMPPYYMWSVDSIDRASLPEKNGLPLLILQGEADFQVTYDADYKAWKDLLGGDDRFTLISYPGLSHIFMPAREGCGISRITEAYALPALVDDGVMKDICDWIKDN